MKPEDTFEIIASVGSEEADLKPVYGNSSQVPTTKFARKIYAIIATDTSGAANTLTIRVYKSDGTTLDRSFDIKLSANETKTIISKPDAPLLTVYAGEYLKAIASGASVSLVMACYDL